ncbi:hypothetical protein [Aeromonas media]|uniref:hypothetical protein n=1 Tax=Aeromonas media TaxID=651 RepID=UPI00209BCE67|nr:hypothetical protein [Aeromonas media]
MPDSITRLEELIVRAIAKFEAKTLGFPDIEQSIEVFSQLVDRNKIQPLCQVSLRMPNLDADQVVAMFAPTLRGDWLITAGPGAAATALMPSVEQPSPPPSQPEPVVVAVTSSAAPSIGPVLMPQKQPSPPIKPLERVLLGEDEGADNGEWEDVIDDRRGRVFDAREQRGPLPVALDNHTSLIIGSGIFRTLNRNVINNPALRPQLDSSQVHFIDPRVMNGYRAMTLAGPVLDTDFDIRTYLCLVRTLGSLSFDEYRKAASSVIELTPEQFYEPLKDVLSPSDFKEFIHDYMRTDKILHSLKRIHSFQMTLYMNPEHAGGTQTKTQGAVMIVGLVSVIELFSDGIIRLTPNMAMQEMYRAANRLIAVNRATVIGFEHPLSRMLAFWVASIGKGQYKGQWVMINQVMSTKTILESVHPIPANTYYKPRHVKMLETALAELVRSGVLVIRVRGDNSLLWSESLNPDTWESLQLNGLKSEVELVSHRISHKNHPHGNAHQQVPSDGNAVSSTGKRSGMRSDPADVLSAPATVQANEIGIILKSINFHRYRFNRPEVGDTYHASMGRLVTIVRSLAASDIALCRRALRSVATKARREKFLALFISALSHDDYEFLAGKCAEAWAEKGATPVEGNRLHEIIVGMPTSASIKDYFEWANTYREQIREFLELIDTSAGRTMLKSIKHIMLTSRLVNPLNKANMQSEAKQVLYRMERLRSGK